MSTDQEPLIQHLDAYADRFVAVDGPSRTLTIKHYHLFKPSRTVCIPAILYIRPASDFVHRRGLMHHGRTRGIRWASDHTRGNALTGPKSGYHRSFIMKVYGQPPRCGFSVEYPDRFLAVLEHLCPGVTKNPTSVDEQEADKVEDSQLEDEDFVKDTYEQ